MNNLSKILSCLLNLWYHFVIITRLNDLYQWCYVRYLRHQDKVNVVFVATLLSQWKYQRVYELLKADSRFNAIILLAPMRHYENSEDYVAMKRMLDSNGVDYVDWEKLSEKDKNIRKSLRPDVMFYVQPYYHMYDKRVDSHSFKDKLICQVPYGFQLYDKEYTYNMEFHNRSWKLFYIHEECNRLAKKYALNRGRNVEVVGSLIADEFINDNYQNVWKLVQPNMKRVIWTPHFSIFDTSTLNQANFLNMADEMLKIAEKYKNKIQFAFKPHPKLRRELYLHPNWGKKRTDEYYDKWASMSNTQIVEGNWIDLFMNSDGLINDSGAFTVVYLYTRKTAINCYANFERSVNHMSIIGKEAVNAQYRGGNIEDVRNFLDEVILNGNDYKKNLRDNFFNKYLLTPTGYSVAENIYQSIKTELILMNK